MENFVLAKETGQIIIIITGNAWFSTIFMKHFKYFLLSDKFHLLQNLMTKKKRSTYYSTLQLFSHQNDCSLCDCVKPAILYNKNLNTTTTLRRHQQFLIYTVERKNWLVIAISTSIWHFWRGFDCFCNYVNFLCIFGILFIEFIMYDNGWIVKKELYFILPA